MMTRIVTSAAGFIFLCMSGLATASELDSAMQGFARAAAGDSAAVESAIEQFERLQAENPSSPFYQARLGSLMTMQARDAWAPWKKMSYTERGLDRIDAALAQLGPQHANQSIAGNNVAIDVRYTAAVTFGNIPKFFNRWSQAERLYDAITRQAEFGQAAPAFQAEVWLSRARLAGQRGQAEQQRDSLQQAYRLDPHGETGRRAQALLAGGQ